MENVFGDKRIAAAFNHAVLVGTRDLQRSIQTPIKKIHEKSKLAKLEVISKNKIIVKELKKN